MATNVANFFGFSGVDWLQTFVYTSTGYCQLELNCDFTGIFNWLVSVNHLLNLIQYLHFYNICIQFILCWTVSSIVMSNTPCHLDVECWINIEFLITDTLTSACNLSNNFPLSVKTSKTSTEVANPFKNGHLLILQDVYKHLFEQLFGT